MRGKRRGREYNAGLRQRDPRPGRLRRVDIIPDRAFSGHRVLTMHLGPPAGIVLVSETTKDSLHVQLSRCPTLDDITSEVRERDLVGSRVPEEMTAAQARIIKVLLFY